MQPLDLELIPEPHGEPGRNPNTINQTTQKPKGYRLQTVLGLAKHQATHNHYMVSDNSDIRFINLIAFMWLQRKQLKKVHPASFGGKHTPNNVAAVSR
jgi:hypothetical protein